MDDPGKGEGGSGPLVLLVDDSEENRALYSEHLVESGFRVNTAVDGLDALDKVAGSLPDVIVMDLSMPDMDGWEAIHRLRDDPAARGIPVVVISGNLYGVDGTGPEEGGCDAYLSKPFPLDDLVAVLHKLLATRSP
jgi:two-component system cell cycle response regulator DivK